MLLTVGELARRCGLTVRTLHHYDAIGLLKPSVRSAAGYRLYDRANIECLHRIQALHQLGLSLTAIGDALSGPQAPLPAGGGLAHKTAPLLHTAWSLPASAVPGDAST